MTYVRQANEHPEAFARNFLYVGVPGQVAINGCGKPGPTLPQLGRSAGVAERLQPLSGAVGADDASLASLSPCSVVSATRVV